MVSFMVRVPRSCADDPSRSLCSLYSPSGSLDKRPDLTDLLTVQATYVGDGLGHLYAHPAKRGERRRTHGPDRSVRDLERHAPAILAPDCEHRLSPALYEELRRVHELRVELSRPRDHKGMHPHRVTDEKGGKGELIGEGIARGD